MPATAPIKAPPIAPVDQTDPQSINRLRQNVQTVIANVVQQVNDSTINSNFDMKGKRILNVSMPTELYDGVPKIYVDKHKGTFTQQAAKSGGKDAYTIVFANSNFIGDGDITPAFIVGSSRSGDKLEAWVYAEGAPTTNSLAVNITVNGTAILSSPLLLASSTTNTATGPIFTTVFAGGTPNFAHGGVVLATFSAGGLAQGVTVGMIVRRK